MWFSLYLGTGAGNEGGLGAWGSSRSHERREMKALALQTLTSVPETSANLPALLQEGVHSFGGEK